MNHHIRKIGIAALLPVILSGCGAIIQESTALDQPSVAEWQKQLQALQVPPMSGPLTLDEAIARALKYNLDRRARQMEQEIASGQLETALQDMLPKANAQLSRSMRDQDRQTWNSDRSAPSGLNNDRNHNTASLGLSWSLLDFGVGYYSAKQAQDRVLVANERRRKLIHTLIQDVRSAYWRAACAQAMRDELRKTIQSAEEALEDARKVEQERVKAPTESLAYQKQLLENLRLLEQIDQELTPAFVELATLINAPQGQSLKLAPQWPELPASPEVDMGTLETLALERNADLKESVLQTRIARQETRKVLARMFPNLSFSTSANYDTDSYLVHQHWNEAGLQLSLNLMNLFTGPSQMKLADAGVRLADQRRMVMQMAVMTQVHLGHLNWLNALKQARRAQQIWGVDARLAQVASAREKALMRGRLETVNAQAGALLSQFRRYQSMAQVQVSESRLRAVLGLEFDDEQLDRMSLQDIQQKVQELPAIVTRKESGHGQS